MGVSRGGNTTKIHALVTENFQLFGLLLSGGQVHDSQCATELLSKVNLDGKTVLGDKAFCSAHIRNFIQAQGGSVCIPDKANSRALHDFDKEFYKARNVVERFWIKNRRHISTRYDKLALSFLNFVFLVAIMLQVYTLPTRSKIAASIKGKHSQNKGGHLSKEHRAKIAVARKAWWAKKKLESQNQS